MSNSLSQPRDAGCETPFKELLQLAAGSGRDVTVITEILKFIDLRRPIRYRNLDWR